MSNQAYISLGGNVGNTQEIFQQALKKIEECIGEIVKGSSIYQTAAWGNTQQNDFLNQVIEIETDQSPIQLLDSLLTIEINFGRERKTAWGPRTLDLDILYFNQEIIKTVDLTVPHPRIKDRKFVLIPLNEIASNWKDPQHNQSINELLNSCLDELEVNKLN